MFQVNNITVKEKDSENYILKNISFEIDKGEVLYIQGPNGSGKSTLLSSITGYPDLEITEGSVFLNDVLINDLSIEERSKKGIFLANQSPISIPGLSLREYLRIIYNIHHSEKLPVFKFKKILEEIAQKINYPFELLSRNLNEGFSGGERKKTEILQLLLINPKVVLLDEVDSGLDKKSREIIFKGLDEFKNHNPESIWVVISHYDEIEKYIKPSKFLKLEKGEQIS